MSHFSAAAFSPKNMACLILYVKLDPSAGGGISDELDFLCY
jgi:hypothetical protein